MQTNTVPEKISVAQTLMGSSDTHVTIACEDKINGGPLGHWMEGMQLRDQVLNELKSSLNTFEELSGKCREWVNLNAEWVKEICVRINSEFHSLSLFVHVKNRAELSLEHRRYVAWLGLAIGERYNLRAEARIVSSRPGKFSFVIEPSGTGDAN